MTWAALLPLAAGIVGFALGRWTRPREQIGERQAGHDPFATPHGWHEAQRIMREDLAAAMTKRNAAADELIKGASDEDPFPEEDERREAAE